MSSTHLTITLFGEFSLTPVNRPAVSIAGDRPISLLAYLLLHRHTAVSRQHLAFILWPDSSDNQARANLRNLFFTLRQTLPDADSFLAADSMTLQWRSDASFTLDVAEFEAALAAAKTAVAAADKIAHLETAVALYKGDLLPGNYDDWIIPLREELRQVYLDALHQLVGLLEQQQDFRVAARIGQRLLQLDPLDETAYIHLMRLYARSGDRAGVRRIYDQCVTTLRRELDVEPAPSTQAAYKQFLRQEAPAAAPPAEITPAAVPSPAARPRPLPQPGTPFVGREAELAHLAEWLADPDCRLITIVGPGGMGKTRLALETAVAHQRIFADGVAFVDLAPIRDADLIAATIAQTLSLPTSDPSPRQSQMIHYLADKTVLLVIDNMEHLLVAADLFTEILAGAPGVKLLVTSRQRLELAEEWLFDLGGLPLPDAQTPLAENSAVALFVQTAQRGNRNFSLTAAEETAVGRICQLVGGIPLALQLAATWVRVLSCAEIAAEIERDLDFLASSQRHLPQRQRSMRAVFDYTWQLLSPGEQAAASRLAVFRGGFTREAAEAVAGASLPVLSALVDKGMVNRGGDGRYHLHELVRQYLLHKLLLTPTDDQEARQAHAIHYKNLAAEAHAQLQGPEGMQWQAQLDADIDNLRAALAWALESQAVELGLRLGGALWRFWWWRGHWREGVEWLEKLLALVDEAAAAVPPTVLAVANQGAGVLARSLGDYAQARHYHRQSLALQRRAGNVSGEAAALNSLGNLALFEADYDEAAGCFSQSMALYQQAGSERGRESALNNLAIVAMYRGDFAQALAWHEENLALSRERGNDLHIAMALGNLGDVYRYLQQYAQAQTVLTESERLLRAHNNKAALAITLYSQGRLALDRGDLAAAAARFGECLHIYQETPDPVALADVLEGMAMLAGKQARPLRCAQLFGAAAALRERTGTAVPHSERAAQQQIQAEMVTAVGEATFQAAWAEGRIRPSTAVMQLAFVVLAENN
ncbi:MAG TPA: BTAD domain-containing putative transcriptional regulator [Chloroflexota bacterium]|nr:BTAD domain-containing putative transcriptional regulator [Chloroflexota bacterium]